MNRTLVIREQFTSGEREWIVPKSVSAICVTGCGGGGGGGGGTQWARRLNESGGGGGASAPIYSFIFWAPPADTKIRIKVGRGGAGGHYLQAGSPGESSWFGMLEFVGGNPGGTYDSANQQIAKGGSVGGALQKAALIAGANGGDGGKSGEAIWCVPAPAGFTYEYKPGGGGGGGIGPYRFSYEGLIQVGGKGGGHHEIGAHGVDGLGGGGGGGGTCEHPEHCSGGTGGSGYLELIYWDKDYLDDVDKSLKDLPKTLAESSVMANSVLNSQKFAETISQSALLEKIIRAKVDSYLKELGNKGLIGEKD